MSEGLVFDLERAVEVDGQDDDDGHEADDHHVHDHVRLEGQVVDRVLAALRQDVILPTDN